MRALYVPNPATAEFKSGNESSNERAIREPVQPAEIDEGARRERAEIGVSRGLARSADVAGALQKLRREKQELVASKGAGHDQKSARRRGYARPRDPAADRRIP